MPKLLQLPIRTERLLLRDYAPGDAEAIQGFAGDPEVTQFMTWGPNNMATTMEFLARVIEEQHERPRTRYELAVVRLDTGQLIGGCGLHIADPHNSAAELGYVLRRDCWRRGYGSEAASALAHAAFTQLELHRLSATCAPENIGSARVLEMIGMRYEGHLRGHLRAHGRWRDSLLYGMLRTDANMGSSPF